MRRVEFWPDKVTVSDDDLGSFEFVTDAAFDEWTLANPADIVFTAFMTGIPQSALEDNLYEALENRDLP